jgi:acetyl esterase
MHPDDELAPEMRRFRQALADGYAAHPSLDSVDLAQARRICEQVRAPLARGGPAMAQTRDLVAQTSPPARLRLHRPVDTRAALPALLYLHGGGWTYFSIDTHDRLMRELAARSGRVVIGVDYALAPEARFPVAVEQVAAAWRWVHAQAAELGLDPRRIALGGDSAGANLSLGAALRLRDAGDAGDMPDALLLNYGAYSDDDSGESCTRYDGPQYTLGRDEVRYFWGQYLGGDQHRDDPRAMPLKGRLHGLPRTCLVVADCDVLRDSSLALAVRLREAGVPVALQRHAGAPHSFLEAMSFSELANRALDQCGAWLREGARPLEP